MLEVGGSVDGVVDMDEQREKPLHYAFSADSPGIYVLQARPVPNTFTTQVTVYDEDNAEVFGRPLGAGRPERMSVHVRKAGRYVVAVQSRTVGIRGPREARSRCASTPIPPRCGTQEGRAA